MYLKPYQLASRDLLIGFMKHPPSGGQPWTVRSLASAVGVSKSKISGLLTGRRPGVTPDEAAAIERALGALPGHLFTPRLSTSTDIDPQETTR